MMTTAVLGKASRLADQVREESRHLDPAKVLLTLLMVVPFVAGWLTGKIVRVAWMVFAWVWTAAVVGFRTAHSDAGPG